VPSARFGPDPQDKRLAACLEGLAKAAGHAGWHEPLKDYRKEALLPGGRKSIEPAAARLHPERVQAARQSLHHLVAKAPWEDEAAPGGVRRLLRCSVPFQAAFPHRCTQPEHLLALHSESSLVKTACSV
jgi:SRSO17 transposase